jgi:hypothetical protein
MIQLRGILKPDNYLSSGVVFKWHMILAAILFYPFENRTKIV